MTLKARLVERALEEGFVMARVCRPDAVPEVPERLAAFVELGIMVRWGGWQIVCTGGAILRLCGQRQNRF